MSLSCLTCQTSQRRDSSYPELGYEKDNSRLRIGCMKVERMSWSGNLTPSRYEKMRSGLWTVMKTERTDHRRLHSTGAVAFEGSAVETNEPRLLRSCGMRRDWSFENLKQTRNENRNNGREF